MNNKIAQCVEKWKNLLLDFSKGNRSYNFRPNKRTTLEITTPCCFDLFKKLAIENDTLLFPRPVEEEDGSENTKKQIGMVDLETTAPSITEQQKSLYTIRQRAKSTFNEQGIHILYLIFGLLHWKEQSNSDDEILSPVVLVPVQLTCESLVSPYKLSILDGEDIKLNPTLRHKLKNDHGIVLPEFSDQVELPEYLDTINEMVRGLGSVECCVHLTLLSYLKMNMYEDLDKNTNRLSANPHIRAICGDPLASPLEGVTDLRHFDHDNETRPREIFQVLDADSSQMDAILASKRGTSFVLQGPPGTGKSQTIVNIISEALADNKKILFVSEKRAALEVVYKRLKSTGLDIFCLSLHDPKTKRNEVLHQLRKVMDQADMSSDQKFSIAPLDALEHKREELNRYHSDLHTICSSYNATIFQIIGKLAKLLEVPDVIFDISGVELLTEEQVDEKCRLLKRLAEVIEKRSRDYRHNCWRYAVAKSLTPTLSQDIDTHLIPLIPRLRELRELLATFHSEYKNDLEYSIQALTTHKEILRIASESPGLPPHWVLSTSLPSLTEDSFRWENIIKEAKEIERSLTNTYKPDFFDIHAAKYSDFFQNGLTYLSVFFKFENTDQFINSLNDITDELSLIKASLDSLYQETSHTAPLLGIEKPITKKELHKFIELCALLSERPIIPTSWFDESTYTKIKCDTPADFRKHQRVIMLEREILKDFDHSVLIINYEPLLQRFRTEYNSFIRYIKSSYYSDLRSIKSYYKNAKRLKNTQIHSLLNSLKERSELLHEIERNESAFSESYGCHYKGIRTDWHKINRTLELFGKLTKLVPSIPHVLQELLQSDELPIESISRVLRSFRTVVPINLYTRLNDICVEPVNPTKPYEEYSKEYGEVIEFARSFIETYLSVESQRKQPGLYSHILRDVESLQKLNEGNALLEDNKSLLASNYGYYYHEKETDWNTIRKALKYADKLKTLASSHNLTNHFVETVCGDLHLAKKCSHLLTQIEDIEHVIEPDLTWYTEMFSAHTREQLYTSDMLVLADKMEDCQSNKHLLEEWIDYRVRKLQCEMSGLEDYVHQIDENEIPAQHIESAYLKRFYVLWLEAMKPQFPYLEHFRGNLHEQLIDEFRNLDKAQFALAAKRIQRKLLNSMPNFRIKYSHRNEVTILKRELQKKTRLKSLRRLFGEIPNLVTTLKPCFMMSPLSVSTFLASEVYDFDLVVFDEASQVHTEDAIGAIMRGKQIIIVGDDKQLPPTNFFRTMLAEDDFEEGDPEKDDDGSYESILNEVKAQGFMEYSLLWHYRSRHEDLIAFSNMNFYEGNLVTFPSTEANLPDRGVEFIYVADGCYENRRNHQEAQLIEELVFEHFRKYGKARSLGVIAFSESQQEAIEKAIIAHRRRDDSFETYFNEDISEAFFVKNLENVQGDERDTIIFSVGYARNRSGKIHMNFGPLNRNGGERRLNVAVTRAKYNVKLVSSILPTDIDLNKTSANGVKMLRSYLEFAQQGTCTLTKEIPHHRQTVEYESPFEESVYEYLTSKGYTVQTQVGCAGYRIDMAVKHPSINGKFAIGIECDGSSYHNSRTARERDRLRQTVLEDMGWVIYRIWSTDWIRHPALQRNKLEEAIRAAFEKCTSDHSADASIQDEVLSVPCEGENPSESDEIADESVLCELPLYGTEETKHAYGFVNYEFTQMNPNWTGKDTTVAIASIISTEQPIHIDELAKRLLPLWKKHKVTLAFKEEVEWRLKSMANSYNILRKGDFLQFDNFSTIKVRIPSCGDPRRDIHHIPDEEIEEAFISIVKESVGITKDKLFRVTANQFGFTKLGIKIKSTFERVYDGVQKKDRLNSVEGKLKVSQVPNEE